MEEVELDLGSPNHLGEEPQVLWRAPASSDEEENIHTCTMVEISDTKPLIGARDPRGVNDCLQVRPRSSLKFISPLFCKAWKNKVFQDSAASKGPRAWLMLMRPVWM